MRGRILNAILAISILTVGAVATASAQLPGTRMSAEIPFAFNVGEQTFSAGTYEVRRFGNDPCLLRIQKVDDRSEAAFFITAIDESRSIRQSTLLFHRYGDFYFLAEIRSQFEDITRELQPSEQERRMKRQLASNKKAPEAQSVMLVAN